MSPQEPEYRTAYEDGKGALCPECGYDFAGESGDAVLAHIEGHHPGFNASLDSETAKARFAILKKIAKERS